LPYPQAALASAQLCVPDCTNMHEGDKVMDPTNCLRFYYCSDPDNNGHPVPSSEPITCPEGFYFNPSPYVKDCDKVDPDKDYCTGLCDPCAIECKEPGTLLPFPRDCHKYLVCLGNNPEPLEINCPDDKPFFDYKTDLCSDDNSLCYNLCDPCKVLCVKKGKVLDPHNCKGYYYCDPPQVAPFECPAGEVFNAQDLVCEASSSGNCTNICEVGLL
ncbi:putative Chitin binding Peritrophin-A domain-containing protein 19, partial [Homarus americanus]